MTIAVFPAGIRSWTDRADQQDTVWADDPNSLAAEIIATETVLGVAPHVEKNPITGNPVTYPTVDARISDVNEGNQKPVVSLKSTQQLVPNGQGVGTNFGQWNTYTQVFDPNGMYNGTDITIPADGWWLVTMGQYWDWYSTGYHGIWFWIDNVWQQHHHWFWEFSENFDGGYWQGGDGVQRNAHTQITWQGVLKQGQRLRALSENGSPHTPHRAYNLEFKALYQRSVPATTPSDALI